VNLIGRGCLSFWCVTLVGCAAATALCLVAGESQAGSSGSNSGCYVCHPTMKQEAITTKHLQVGITCGKCHGPSIEHMHDEMLMTKPDLLFGRSEVAGMCIKCHSGHENPEAVEEFRKKWSGRIRPNGRTINEDSVCTDCHGTHNIDKGTGNNNQAGQQSPWVNAFNGRDLAGWEAPRSGSWVVKAGRLMGTADAKTRSSSLWSEDQYEDYLLAVTFRMEGPVRAGIWLRGDGSKGSVRIEIFESSESRAYTGSLSVIGQGLVLRNIREDLVDRQGWNTISARVEAGRVQIWLNGEEIGAVRTTAPQKGRIGLYVERLLASKKSEFCVREVQVRKLAGKATGQ